MALDWPPDSRMIFRPEPPSFPCSGVTCHGRRMEMLLEKLVENVHEDATKITLNRECKRKHVGTAALGCPAERSSAIC